MRTATLTVLLLSAACGASPSEGPTSTATTSTTEGSSTTAGTSPGVSAPKTDSEWKLECEKCLAAGMNWTGDTCHKSCLQDTWCYGPGNSAAPTCPADGPPAESKGD